LQYFGWDLVVGRSGFAFFAGEFLTYVGGAACWRGDPGAEGPGWVVADVLGVAAFEVGDPMAFGILVKRDDFARWGHGSKEDFTTDATKFTKIRKGPSEGQVLGCAL
jgi:hypothetical protein